MGVIIFMVIHDARMEFIFYIAHACIHVFASVKTTTVDKRLRTWSLLTAPGDTDDNVTYPYQRIIAHGAIGRRTKERF